MTQHSTGTRQEWQAARLAVLKDEKELTRQSDVLAARRQALPWVRVEKDYRFDTDKGQASLKDLFDSRSQLLVYHFMFGPDYEAGCPSCSSIADGYDGIVPHLQNHDVAFWTISRAPLEKLEAFKRRMGWTFPWASSGGSDFNADFSVFFTEDQQREGDVEYNWRREPAMDVEALAGRIVQQWEQPGEETPVARIAAMSARNFTRAFRREVGISPSDYVDLTRIDVARYLLEGSRLSIDTIAAKSGFGSPRAMRRAFLAYVGATPSDYRERFRTAGDGSRLNLSDIG